MSSSRPQHWRFGLLYFISFASISLPGIYGNLFLERSGVSKYQLGVLGAISAWVSAFAPLFWGLAADALQRFRPVLGGIHLAAGLLYPLFWFWAEAPFWRLAVLMALFAFCFRPAIPLTDAWTLGYLREHGGDYGRLRSWGSLGFIAPLAVSVFVLGGEAGASARSLWPIFVGFTFFKLIAVGTIFALPDRRAATAKRRFAWRELSAYLHPFAIVFFGASFLRFVVFTGYYTYFSIYLDEIGVPDNWKGSYWVVAVGAETLLIAVSGQLLRRWGVVPMLLSAFVAMTVRLAVWAMVPPWSVVLLTQTLHAFTFGAFHVASMYVIDRLTPEALRASGQTFYALVQGVGGILGGFLSGLLAEAYGIPSLYGWLAVLSLATTLSVGSRLC
ncbi:MAG: MFS transporter [Candidatus Poribacteria bacterium]|nr:MAG: MFS transporter [Candidatus Poribacteria bacterium]